MDDDPKPMYPPDYGQSNNVNVPMVSPEYLRHQTRNGGIAMSCAVVGMLFCVGALIWILALRASYESGKFPMIGTNIVNVLERILVYGIGFSLGGIASLIGFVLGLKSIDSKLGLFAIIVSLVGPICMLGWALSLIFLLN